MSRYVFFNSDAQDAKVLTAAKKTARSRGATVVKSLAGTMLLVGLALAAELHEIETAERRRVLVLATAGEAEVDERTIVVDVRFVDIVPGERIVLDPGIGFGKTVAQNFSLLARQRELLDDGYPLLAGWSRKSSLGAVTGRDQPVERVSASVAAAVLAVERGARIVRVHDVRETVDALRVWQAMQAEDAAASRG